ncbi:MAG TPA: tail fiber domain-containing protein [Flavobacteriales bacterium]|nr:tail fiber domain-containing protein [Flavobacteriales bacterium]
MRLNESLPGQPVNNFPNVDLSGHLGIGAPVPPQALSFLHINNNGSFFAGFRPWMRTGVSMSENTDWMYVGAKHQGEDLVDAVINWGDNKEADPTYGPDALRFIFTRTMSNINIASQMDGLELARIIPDPSGNQGYFGIGDYFTAATNPSERLDVLNGRVAIRELPTNPVSASMEAVVVNTSTGVLEHRPFPTTTGGPDCDWTPIAGAINELRTANAPAGTVGACPDQRWKVQIGTPSTAGPYRLTVGVNQVTCANCGITGGTNVDVKGDGGGSVNGSNILVESATSGSANQIKGLKIVTRNAGSINYGIEVDATNNVANISSSVYGAWIKAVNQAGGKTAQLYGLRGSAEATDVNSATLAKGVWGRAVNGITNDGLRGEATGGSSSTNYGVYSDASSGVMNYGLHAKGSGATGSTNYGVWTLGQNGTTNYGVLANAIGGGGSTNYGVWATASGGATNWAGYFKGRVMITDSAWVLGNQIVTSDANLKTNVEDLTGALDKVLQMQPKTYEFIQDALPQAHLTEGPQVGLIAQELEPILPEAVGHTTVPAELDSLGAEIFPAVAIAGIDYNKVTPVLIGAIKEQQAMIDQQQATIAQLQDQINHCCATQGDAAQRGSAEQGSMPQENELQEQRLLIIPNPVADLTTLEYYVPKAGKVSLQVSTSDGKPLATLREELAETGAYNYSWNTTKLAAGTYFCTFMLDGAVVVKRAVKVK